MTNKEAIKMQEAIKAGLKETGKDHPYRDALIPLMKESCDMAIKALEGKDTNVPSADTDTISRQATITEFKNYERDSTAPIDYVKIVEQMPPAQPQYTELTPEEAASEIASGSIMSASYWLDAMIRLKQMGYAICRKKG